VIIICSIDSAHVIPDGIVTNQAFNSTHTVAYHILIQCCKLGPLQCKQFYTINEIVHVGLSIDIGMHYTMA